jgi:hypothetical protein
VDTSLELDAAASWPWRLAGKEVQAYQATPNVLHFQHFGVAEEEGECNCCLCPTLKKQAQLLYRQLDGSDFSNNVRRGTVAQGIENSPGSLAGI